MTIQTMQQRIATINESRRKEAQWIDTLLLLFRAHPEWPIEAMVRELTITLNTTDGRHYRAQLKQDTVNHPNAQSVAARRKASQLRHALVVATNLVLNDTSSKRGASLVERVAAQANIPLTVLRRYFPTKHELLWVVYHQLISF